MSNAVSVRDTFVVYQDGKDITDLFKVNNFPDGQLQLYVTQFVDWENRVVVIADLRNSEDLDLLRQLAWLIGSDTIYVVLNVAYLYGSRCDKNSYGYYECVNVHRRLIEELGNRWGYVKVFVPHGDVDHPNVRCFNLQNSKFTEIAKRVVLESCQNTNLLIVYPDESAHARVSQIFEYTGGTEVFCKKVRDQKTGSIISFELEDSSIDIENWNGPIVVVDDIVDGGATFVRIGELLKTNTKSKKYLVTAHGLFSNGFDELNRYYDHYISTTWDGVVSKQGLAKEEDVLYCNCGVNPSIKKLTSVNISDLEFWR